MVIIAKRNIETLFYPNYVFHITYKLYIASKDCSFNVTSGKAGTTRVMLPGEKVNLEWEKFFGGLYFD